MDKRAPIAIVVISLILIIGGAYYFNQQQIEKNDKLVVVATFYPLAYMAEQIGGEKVEVTTLIEPGLEPHSFQPSAGDLVKCSNADIIIYNGAGLDDWLQEDILPSIDAKGKIIVNTTQTVTLIANHEQDEHEETEESEEHEEHEHGIYDPHTWVSPYEAKQQAEAIYKAFQQKDPDHAEYYETRWEILQNKLETLDTEYQAQLKSKIRDTIFVTHDAFGYIAHRYGFETEGIIGVSADEQPSTQTLVNIINLMQQKETYIFFIEPGYSDSYVQTVKTELQSRSGNTIQIYKLYHLDGPQDGLDYLSQMEKNLQNLRLGLG